MVGILSSQRFKTGAAFRGGHNSSRTATCGEPGTMSGESKDAPPESDGGGWGWGSGFDIGNLDITATVSSLAEQAQKIDLEAYSAYAAEQANAIDVTSSLNYAAEQASKMAKDIESTVEAGLNADAAARSDEGQQGESSSFGLDWMSGAAGDQPRATRRGAPVRRRGGGGGEFHRFVSTARRRPREGTGARARAGASSRACHRACT